MKAILKVLVIVLALAGACIPRASAASPPALLADACAMERADAINPESALLQFASTRTSIGLTCEQIKGTMKGMKVIGLAVRPVGLILSQSGATAEITTELAAAGLAVSSPVVLGVTAVGAAGMSVVYIALTLTMDECERMDKQELQESLMKELERKYNLKGSGTEKLEVQ